jgi:hypothetical protein
MILRGTLPGYETSTGGVTETARGPSGANGDALSRGLVGAWDFGQPMRNDLTIQHRAVEDRSGYNNHLTGFSGNIDPYKLAVSDLKEYRVVSSPVVTPTTNSYLRIGNGLSQVQSYQRAALLNASDNLLDCTVAFRYKSNGSYSNTNGVIFDCGYSGIGVGGFAIGYDTTTNTLVIYVDSANSGISVSLDPSAFTTLFVRARASSSSALSLEVYKDLGASFGRDRISFAGSVSLTGLLNNTLARFITILAANSLATARMFQGRMSWLHLWRRQITLEEMRRVAEHPFCMVTPTMPWMAVAWNDPNTDLAPTGYSDPDVFGSHTVIAHSILNATGYNDADLFGSTVVLNAQVLVATGFTSTNSFGTSSVAYSLHPTSHSNTNQFGSATILLGDLLRPDSHVNLNNFGVGSLAQFFFFGFLGPTHTME